MEIQDIGSKNVICVELIVKESERNSTAVVQRGSVAWNLVLLCHHLVLTCLPCLIAMRHLWSFKQAAVILIVMYATANF